ncbi:Aromatic acid exporter family member 1 [Carnobacterium iners]|uniref:Aromatic acid exporter family member 1 n=1 Tax=Carnobacterium iners TaxID=1073423 RepID=A0A1X7N820_9LACT|nr:aromatic acid exporter family protein [Carnobacterium iners]SEK46138.1 Aromatic acid exporter family member 1 [Carnobacterium iners]SMH33055.1 Aromatic acid exporter family member 1 [Carnobacterium iners]
MMIGEYRIGMRTVKTAIAVASCILLFHFTNRGAPMIASLTAIFVLREDWRMTFKFSKNRILGNSIGAFTATLVVLVQNIFGTHFLIELIGVPVAIIFIIVICDLLKNNAGIIGGTAAFLIIYYTIPIDDALFYAIQRIFDTFIGAFIAIFINLLIPYHSKK